MSEGSSHIGADGALSSVAMRNGLENKLGVTALNASSGPSPKNS
jgi:hypothetical protein